MLECFTKKMTKGIELATPVAAVTKKGKRQMTEDESDGDNEQNYEPITKWRKKVATITQNTQQGSPEM
jgi:hypothetical protein